MKFSPSKLALAAVAGASLLLAGCASTQATAFPVGAHGYPAKPASAPVELYRGAPPTRPFEVVAQLNVHLEKTFFVHSAFEDALPQLESLARQHGADALIKIEEKKSQLNETFIYNVTASAIVFTDK